MLTSWTGRGGGRGGGRRGGGAGGGAQGPGAEEEGRERLGGRGREGALPRDGLQICLV